MSTAPSPTLSKSRFIAGLQCPLRLWNQCFRRELAAEITPAQQAIFDMGHAVGHLATQRFRGGVTITEDYLHHTAATRATRSAMEQPEIKAIYEAGFVADDVKIRVDVFERDTGGEWNLIEVKSSASVKDVYLYDVAVQYHVLQASGVTINRAVVMHLNNQYVFDGSAFDLTRLFTLADVTPDVKILQPQVIQEIAVQHDTINRSRPPAILPGRHCTRPYRCEFFGHCTRHMPEHYVLQLPGLQQSKLDELAAMGVQAIGDIPDTFPLTALQERIRTSVVTNQPFVGPQLAEVLRDAAYPVHFIDFETTSPALPRYPGSRPYQTHPFQWSAHTLHTDDRVEHQFYLCEQDMDPAEPFTAALLEAVGDQGTVYIYTPYERTVLNALKVKLPHFAAQIEALVERLVDLHAILRTHYYHVNFHGSFSLKAVLPAVLPEMDYQGLEIQEGTMASFEYLRMLDPATSPAQKRQIKQSLLDYCSYDTLALLKIREALLQTA